MVPQVCCVCLFHGTEHTFCLREVFKEDFIYLGERNKIDIFLISLTAVSVYLQQYITIISA